MKITTITRCDFSVTNWAGGKTEQIYIYPENANYALRNFTVRISTAIVETDVSEFTLLPNVKRTLIPLSDSITLKQKTEVETKFLVTLQPFDVYRFSGSIPIISYGNCRDFNVMTMGKAVSQTVVLKPAENCVFRQQSFCLVFSYDAEGTVLINGTKQSLLPLQALLIGKPDTEVALENGCGGNIIAVGVDIGN